MRRVASVFAVVHTERVKRSSAGPELPTPHPPERGISDAKAQLLAEGATWLATGRAVHDETKPMGRVLAQMEHTLPRETHLEWLLRPNEALDGHRPMDFVDADQLGPLEAVLAQMPNRPDAANGNGSGRGAA